MRKIGLTKKRKKWVAPRKNVTLEGDRLSYNVGVQAQYVRALKRLVTEMADETTKQISKLFESETAQVFYATDENIASQARILTNKLINKFESLFGRKAKAITEAMVNKTNRASKSNLHNSLKKLSGGVSIKTDIMPEDLKTILNASVVENVALIKSVSSDYLSKVQKLVMRSIVNGEGLPSILPALEKYKGISERHAKNVALDQTRKVYNSMNAARMKKVGVQKFKWIHSGGGQKPRQSHIEMNGNIYSFDNLPIINLEQVNKGYEAAERGIPGQAINCRCTMVPVIEFNEGDE